MDTQKSLFAIISKIQQLSTLYMHKKDVETQNRGAVAIQET